MGGREKSVRAAVEACKAKWFDVMVIADEVAEGGPGVTNYRDPHYLAVKDVLDKLVEEEVLKRDAADRAAKHHYAKFKVQIKLKTHLKQEHQAKQQAKVDAAAAEKKRAEAEKLEATKAAAKAS